MKNTSYNKILLERIIKNNLYPIVNFVSIPQHTWQWQHRSEVRVSFVKDPTKLYWASSNNVVNYIIIQTDVDARYSGKRSAFGKAIIEGNVLCKLIKEDIITYKLKNKKDKQIMIDLLNI
jgi:hypothetical protein